MKKRFYLLILVFLLLVSGCRRASPENAPQHATPTPAIPVIRVHFVDVGQGDGILLETWEGKNMVIDGGDRRSGFNRYLRQHKVKTVDAMVSTNPDADHIGGLIEVLNSLSVKEVWLSGQENTTLTFEDYVNAIARSGATVRRVRRGDRFNLGSIVFNVLHPVDTFFSMRNNNSVVLKFKFGNISFLFAGDAEKEAEMSMIASGLPLESTILKLGHHGSRTSTSLPFLVAVKPQLAVYQAGMGNKFGHPHPETIKALSAAGVRTLGTDINGAIIISTDGMTYTIRTER